MFSVLSYNLKFEDKIIDLILFITLIFLEPDRIIYHETYDPLLYFIFFLLIKNKIYLNFAMNLTSKKFILLIIFSISFLSISILKTLINV